MQTIDIHAPQQPRPEPAPEVLPAANDPWVIARNPALSPQVKIERLRQLEFDVRQALVAREEGMSGISTLPTLAEILAAIADVDPKACSAPTPTKC